MQSQKEEVNLFVAADLTSPITATRQPFGMGSVTLYNTILKSFSSLLDHVEHASQMKTAVFSRLDLLLEQECAIGLPLFSISGLYSELDKYLLNLRDDIKAWSITLESDQSEDVYHTEIIIEIKTD